MVRVFHLKPDSAMSLHSECLLTPWRPDMTASMHLPVRKIVECGREPNLVYGMQRSCVMGLCHYRHMISVDTLSHHLGRA